MQCSHPSSPHLNSFRALLMPAEHVRSFFDETGNDGTLNSVPIQKLFRDESEWGSNENMPRWDLTTNSNISSVSLGYHIRLRATCCCCCCCCHCGGEQLVMFRLIPPPGKSMDFRCLWGVVTNSSLPSQDHPSRRRKLQSVFFFFFTPSAHVTAWGWEAQTPLQ